MFRRRLVMTLLMLTVALPVFAAEGIAPSAEETKPIPAGGMLPDVSVATVEGETVKLKDALGGKPTALVFYRGGWCPYCVRHLAGLKDAEPTLKELGFQIVGITPEGPAKIAETIKDKELDYTIVSDGELEAAKAFGLAFDLGAVTALAYRGYGATLPENALPVPAVYLVDAEGKLVFAYANPDYKTRLSNDDLLEAARKAVAPATEE
ncbi:MAG: redoxin domain-containing protein [Candidatus Hydrogenedens sp.]|nr:redoxin domain-containing protein [Candidatus Hydrogenedens sp.]